MRETVVRLKDGRSLVGWLWDVRPREGFFTLGTQEDVIEIMMDDCASVVTKNQRISATEVGDHDRLAEWNNERDGYKRAATKAAAKAAIR
jgi:hypothetical protein